jgi:hypothetical protein
MGLRKGNWDDHGECEPSPPGETSPAALHHHAPEGTGPILGAQVKTVDDEEQPRLKLNRIDATDLLRQSQATCLFGIRLSDKSIHFQFLTKEFIDQLLSFLQTTSAEFSIVYENILIAERRRARMENETI